MFRETKQSHWFFKAVRDCFTMTVWVFSKLSHLCIQYTGQQGIYLKPVLMSRDNVLSIF